MGMIGNPHDYLILTNNPLVADCLDGRGTTPSHIIRS